VCWCVVFCVSLLYFPIAASHRPVGVLLYCVLVFVSCVTPKSSYMQYKPRLLAHSIIHFEAALLFSTDCAHTIFCFVLCHCYMLLLLIPLSLLMSLFTFWRSCVRILPALVAKNAGVRVRGRRSFYVEFRMHRLFPMAHACAHLNACVFHLQHTYTHTHVRIITCTYAYIHAHTHAH